MLSKLDQTAAEVLPRVHLIFSLLKRWILGTHQGSVSLKHLDGYLEEFTFRFNRRRARRITHGGLSMRLPRRNLLCNLLSQTGAAVYMTV